MLVVVKMNGVAIDKDFYSIARIRELNKIEGITLEIVKGV